MVNLDNIMLLCAVGIGIVPLIVLLYDVLIKLNVDPDLTKKEVRLEVLFKRCKLEEEE